MRHSLLAIERHKNHHSPLMSSSDPPPSSAAETRSSPTPKEPNAGNPTSKPRVGHGSETPQEQIEDVIRSDLGFTVPLLVEYPKCYWIWKYRLWILDQATNKLSIDAARAIWDAELGLVSKMLIKDRRNFHAWGYRRHVVSQLESAVLAGRSAVESEFEYTTKAIHEDLSNFSAWHNRSHLIPRLLLGRGSESASREKFLDAGEIPPICFALSSFGGDGLLFGSKSLVSYARLSTLDQKISLFGITTTICVPTSLNPVAVAPSCLICLRRTGKGTYSSSSSTFESSPRTSTR